ncbi:hypothetical protein [Candidatus Galacturonibacter soehngenii]|uniref:Transmembrane protein n=1 Tax=Candidatus Galacturonatibacter soehngenii TaxID=2307010 RepID=A0A7V7QLX9_9FIRM|nr:hypothetical protein [Candidatus Galacturonibacter soehngenii]KAB1439448.1 hypothetical protein F7O84_03365 [Candidatus Galacturonibacter soehngenii]
MAQNNGESKLKEQVFNPNTMISPLQSSEIKRAKIRNHMDQVVRFIKRVKHIKSHINQKMEGKYSPSLIALFATALASLLMLLMLFLPNYLGVADDGSISRVMNSAGIYYTQSEISEIYNNYFVKIYSNVLSGYQTRDSLLNSQVLFVKAAVYLDNLITKDKFFDIRFLALLYGIFYIPAFYLLIKQACMRVQEFSEGFVIGFVGVLIFADVGYITYFNSFYPEALWFISFMYCIFAALSFQNQRSSYKDFGALVVIVVSGIILTTSRSQTTIIALLLAVFCLKLLFIRNNWIWGVICIASSIFLCIVSVINMLDMESDFDNTSKFHAMTRGVLYESQNPSETLLEFDIDPSYELLADASSHDYLPVVKATDPVLSEFIEKYTQLDIAVYYVRHPGALLGMLDVAIKSCFDIRREYCGNYEKSVGLPERAKSFFWGAWSNFKSNTLPKTIGYFVFLIGVCVLQFRKGYSLRFYEERRNTVFMDTVMLIVLICISQAIIIVVNSGDSQMIQHGFLIGFGIDIITYIIFTEIVHRIKIF